MAASRLPTEILRNIFGYVAECEATLAWWRDGNRNVGPSFMQPYYRCSKAQRRLLSLGGLCRAWYRVVLPLVYEFLVLDDAIMLRRIQTLMFHLGNTLPDQGRWIKILCIDIGGDPGDLLQVLDNGLATTIGRLPWLRALTLNSTKLLTDSAAQTWSALTGLTGIKSINLPCGDDGQAVPRLIEVFSPALEEFHINDAEELPMRAIIQLLCVPSLQSLQIALCSLQNDSADEVDFSGLLVEAPLRHFCFCSADDAVNNDEERLVESVLLACANSLQTLRLFPNTFSSVLRTSTLRKQDPYAQLEELYFDDNSDRLGDILDCFSSLRLARMRRLHVADSPKVHAIVMGCVASRAFASLSSVTFVHRGSGRSAPWAKKALRKFLRKHNIQMYI